MSPLWTPSPERIAATELHRFARHLEGRGSGPLPDYAALHRFSIDEPARFWREFWEFAEVIGDPGTEVLRTGDTFRQTRFFPEATLNVAENLLRHNDDRPALIFRAEDRLAYQVTWAELHHQVSLIQQALLDCGVAAGDRVAAWLPNRPETYALMLAAASIGAVFTSTSPDFGAAGVVDRFGQTTPKVLVATDGYQYNGTWHDRLEALGDIVSELPSVEQLVIVPYDHSTGSSEAPAGSSDLPGQAQSWTDWLAPHTPAAVSFTPLAFDHPWYVLYSSGTTGKPKCIVHRCGGVLLKHLTEHKLHSDVRNGDRVFYFTTAGWMMWNWLASGLAAGATLVLYDGSPFHPDGNRLFDLVEETGATLMGVSAKFIEALGKAGLTPCQTHDLSSVRTICSTGSPLVAEGFAYVYENIATDVHLASISGGTDLCGCLVAGDPTGPVHAGEIQRAGLGMEIDVVDDSGTGLPPGQQGELVCRSPFPSMPLRFWNDDGDQRYQAAYFERFDGMWHQGDFAEWTPDGGMVIHGRSDATLNPGGVRIGTAEIYRIVDALPQITESLVIGQRWGDDTRVVLFVIPAQGVSVDDELRAAIRGAVRSEATPRHVPAQILAVPDIPRTRSGKISELAVREVVHGRPVKNLEALANPEALDHYANRPELQP